MKLTYRQLLIIEECLCLGLKNLKDEYNFLPVTVKDLNIDKQLELGDIFQIIHDEAVKMRKTK